jgi:ketosteroid isomerase-like protein
VSQENVEIVRRIGVAWQRDDLDTWLFLLDPTIEWHTLPERLVEGAESFYRGYDGVQQFWHRYRSEFDLAFEIQGVRDVGDDRVVLLGHARLRGAASGIETETPVGLVMTVRRGKVIRSFDYPTHDQALKAVGLEE